WKTGHSWIKQKMHEENAPLAGEMSGHFFFSQGYYGFDDGLFAALKLIEFLSTKTESLSEIVSTIPFYYSTAEIEADCADKEKYSVVEKLTSEFKEEGFKVIDINGARVVFEDGWGLVRASSNLPKLVLRFEAKTRERLAEIKHLFRKKIGKFLSVSKKWENDVVL
ncbi:phosphomannomutase/phosphoglucomutase, partial [Candidatus Uhrbacteria bacterium]|nr:phosphomannomutase/phosphoglucomutase [Candidatus Uhrbacteria bacterium]